MVHATDLYWRCHIVELEPSSCTSGGAIHGKSYRYSIVVPRKASLLKFIPEGQDRESSRARAVSLWRLKGRF